MMRCGRQEHSMLAQQQDVDELDSSEVEKLPPLALMIARFAAIAERGAVATSDLETADTLRFIFSTLAQVEAAAIKAPIKLDNADHPGFLIYDIRGRSLYVPFHLAAVFPTTDVLVST